MAAKPTALIDLKVIAQVAGLLALAIVLRFFEIPYPPAPFLKYDVSGVPLVLISLMSLRYAFSSLPLYYVVPVAMGSDPIGMAMKCLAEASTFTPLALMCRRSKCSLTRKTSVAAALIASLARIGVMSASNYIVTPYWLLWAGWIKALEEARMITLGYLPHVAIFNLTLALIVASISMTAYTVLKRSGYLR
ncbi:MAG: hypothetical protein QW701_01580 [Candidatus Nezhaarchaeales archaeon]